MSMVNLETVRLRAAQLAQSYRALSALELREWFEATKGADDDNDSWSAFRSAYFDSLWAGAEELATKPVIATTGFPKSKPLTDCAHLTLAFVAGSRLELIDFTVEDDCL